MSNRKSINRKIFSGLFNTTALALIAGSAFAQSMPGPAPAPQAQPSMASGSSAPTPQQPSLSLPPTTNLSAAMINSANAEEIRRINEEMTVMTARLAQLDLQAKITARQKEISGTDKTADSLRSPLSSSASTPSVVSVSGLKGHLEAVLVFPQGLSQRVKKGDVIGDRKVAVVAINEVVLTDVSGKNPQRLAFGTSATPITRESSPTGAGGLTAGAMPGVPPQYPPR